MTNKFGIINNDIKHVSQTIDSKPTPQVDSKKAKDFQELLKGSIQELNQEQKAAEKALGDMATGQIKDLHQAAIAIGRAETSMKVMLEVRNKAISAYKEILRTQV
ncbi:flagellar hook-basal body complex protein FliE [Helicobacter kayseriensis]|uniref:flagellar hook-basal body complex protein FliE n=1 Tax=Helicobacter kayseriensis TaxID=2905877 RepID=UPI001E2DBC1A|nr:flagellar hook-basal body complex protein FliE [Helicobacter kayseriensis]MCE3047608.1 flagellar hook-basal body complex protein FliE [Helicobacter kayseriensis]MCE3048979.1 flagellar hook-basal body complex protein FliE [Helicobacter kayseriensis]